MQYTDTLQNFGPELCTALNFSHLDRATAHEGGVSPPMTGSIQGEAQMKQGSEQKTGQEFLFERNDAFLPAIIAVKLHTDKDEAYVQS